MLNGKPLEEVTSAKLLGLNISSLPKMERSCITTSKEGLFLVVLLETLKRSQVKPEELMLFYITWIRSIPEYACHKDWSGQQKLTAQ